MREKRPLFAASEPQKKTHWYKRAGYVLWTALKRTCMVIGGFVLLSSLISIFIVGSTMNETVKPLPDKFVLYLPISDNIVEHQDEGYSFSAKPLTVQEITKALDKAASDDRVIGFVATLNGGGFNMAQAQELRAAIKRFRDAGKFTKIYGVAYGEAGNGLLYYYLASAFDEVWMHPVGVLSIMGLQAEVPFGREALDKIGVEPQFFARKEYKNFFESLTRDEMSPASKEMMTSIVKDIGTQFLSEVSADRGKSASEMQTLINQGLFTDTEAMQVGLIDRLEYIDVFNKEMRRLVTGDEDSKAKIFIAPRKYLNDPLNNLAVGTTDVALVYILGNIVRSSEGGAANLGAADHIYPVFTDIAEMDHVKAVVIRIDSPGGSPVAAEKIRRGVEVLKEEGKHVVVSMGGTTASGGYWIAASADRIFALPSTFTGSIGVTGGKFSLQELWGNIGVNWDGVSWGDNAGMWSFNRPYTEAEAVQMNKLMDSVYDQFITLVADGRGMTKEQVDAVAGGRVWTGAQAQQVGLVDELGGLEQALDYTALQLGKESRSDLRVIVMPKPKSTFEQIIELLEMQSNVGLFFTRNKDILNTASTYAQRYGLFEEQDNVSVREDMVFDLGR